MKTTPYIDSSVAKDFTSVRLPARVCMHVLETARTDGRVLRAATALKEAGFAVSIVDIENAHSQKIEDIDGISVKHVNVSNAFMTTRFRRLGFMRALSLFLRSMLLLMQTPADIYHAHDMTALPACYLVALLRRKPLIFDAHELPLKELESANRRWLRLLLTPMLAVMIRHSTGIISSSPLYAQEICKRYHVAKVSLIRNLPPYRSVLKSDRLHRHLGLSSPARIALYQGNVQPDRGLDTLVHAAKFLARDIIIVIMGKAVKETLSQLNALITSEGVADRVKIIPPVPYEELLDWTASADLGLNVLPPDYSLSIRMSLPNKLFEYLMAGLPVLTSPLDAVTEVISTYDVGQTVSSLAPVDVGNAVNTILADDVALARMHRNALNAAQHELRWEREMGKLIHFYRDILNLRFNHDGVIVSRE
jgi:glycosyltransferase involved in cell wall biosynthesis